jgi:regulator of cell morphogenesis and NO signaling
MTTALTDSYLDYSTATVADLALHFPHAIPVLNKYNLDYCCNGKTPFLKACESSQLDAVQIWREVQQFGLVPASEHRLRFENWDAGLLIDFILQHHHSYVREAIPTIQELVDKVCDVHGDDSPHLLEVREVFQALAEELLQHLPKEEEVLFPAIRKILEAQSPDLTIQFVQAPMQVMEAEHDRAGELVKRLRQLTANYTAPAEACPTYQMTYTLLKEFDRDLIQHIHLENNLLFPKVKV